MLQQQHPNPQHEWGVRQGEPTAARGHKGNLAGSLSIALLPFPAGLAGCERLVSTAGLPGRPSIWEEGGSRSLTPRGRELLWQAQRPGCSAPLPSASLWGSQARLEPSAGWARRAASSHRQRSKGWLRGPPTLAGAAPPGSDLPTSTSATSGGDGDHQTGHSQDLVSGLHPAADTIQPAPCTERGLFSCTGRHDLADTDCWVHVLMSPCLLI